MLHADVFLKDGSFLQDDEIEETTLLVVNDLFKAAKINHTPTVYFLVNRDINAAATLQGTLIIFTGFVLNCKTIEEFIGVLAHETAHIKGAHSALRDFHAGNATIPGILAIALSGVAALATGNGEIFAAGAMGGLGMMERGVLKYSRTQEDTADAGALTILETLKWPADGLMSFLKTIDQKYNISGMDPYLLTHPLTPSRISKIQAYLKEHKNNYHVPLEYVKRFARMRGKIAGFTQEPNKTLRDYAGQNSEEAHYGRAIAYYRLRKMDNLKKELDLLLKDSPNDTYFLELKGQFEFESGKHAQAIESFKQAKQYRKKNSLGLDVMMSHALIEAKGDMNKVVDLLTPQLEKDPSQVFGWRLLGIAYGKMGKEADASGCLAEAAFLTQDYKMAKSHALKAKSGSRASIRARAESLLKQLDKENE
jgi:predicted Zn-dependent protease